MNKRQIKICESVIRYKNLNEVLMKNQIADYLEIQDILGHGNLHFSDDRMDDNTQISLNDKLIEEVEQYRSRLVDVRFTRTLAILAFIISVIALLGQLGIL